MTSTAPAALSPADTAAIERMRDVADEAAARGDFALAESQDRLAALLEVGLL